MKFLSEVLKEIEPESLYKDEIMSKAQDIISTINKRSKNVKAILGGSGAKGTWLKVFDADIFVKFDYNKYKDKSDKLSEELEKILKKDFKKIIRLHGSRDYFQIKKGKFTFEIVPILDIKKAKEAKNITDVSPLHARWVLKHKKYQDEIRLMKQFCKAQKVYGAESYINGFSGYVCEIITIHYGSFQKAVRAASRWKEKEVIDFNRTYKRKDIFRELNTSKLVSPIIVIDPVQTDRNAAAALSYENLEKFVKACKNFLKKPSKSFFIEKKFSLEDIKKKNKDKKVISLEVRPLAGKEDIVGCKIVKVIEFFKTELKKYEFKLKDNGWDWGEKAILYFILDKKILPPEEVREGPEITMKEHVKTFSKKYKKTFNKKGKIYAKVKRVYRKPEDLIKVLIKEKYVKERVKDIKVI